MDDGDYYDVDGTDGTPDLIFRNPNSDIRDNPFFHELDELPVASKKVRMSSTSIAGKYSDNGGVVQRKISTIGKAENSSSFAILPANMVAKLKADLLKSIKKDITALLLAVNQTATKTSAGYDRDLEASLMHMCRYTITSSSVCSD